ncbi:DedA family protein [Anaerobacillus isosaccharinicus]|uniref:DedA family protein n=1 Tax=Anaerobacillus isosaccharinicus TaxID=1532552 RepID=A0A1S2LAT2_9BACI|nr:DedA family protein [Anaerobacillus isosaccharinicus]MBA5588119.1 DedA family protein [Anaerobacillus isosaccharinicus]QOY38424.1 DedA family protein [Anaerobacillus isosaccharinicus]
MELDGLLEVLNELGYVGIFLWLWLGMLGIPIPNEAIVTSIGYLSGTQILQADKVFVMGYLGIVASLTTSYLLGRVIGKTLVNYFSKKRGTKSSIRKAVYLIKKYHVYSLVVSYFIPGVRIFVPFLYGMMRLSYVRFAVLSYTTALLWFCLFFFFGMITGKNEDLSILMIIAVIVSISIITMIFNSHKKKKRVEESFHS